MNIPLLGLGSGLVFGLSLSACGDQTPAMTQAKPLLPTEASVGKSPRSFATGRYRSLFREIGKGDAEVRAKIDAAWHQLFEGDAKEERVYFPIEGDMAYIKDIGSDDVRSEGMSYGMMIAVQTDHKAEFDRLWRWAKTHMQHKSGPWRGYFAWHCKETGEHLSEFPASDGEEYFATALFFAAGRWGSGKGDLNYRAEADAILHAMLHKERDNGGIVETARNMFDLREHQVVFVPNGDAAKFTDPSYHLPAFYELWALWAKEDRAFWREAAERSRRLFRQAAHPKTGLFPDYSTFDGKPQRAPWDPNSKNDAFGSDAFRVGFNIALDHAWWAKDPWQVEQSERMLGFFAAQKPDYVSGYTLDGTPTVAYKAGGHVAMNALVAGATRSERPEFVRALWDAPIPRGQWRYYDGMLYMFGLLHASGQYRIWAPK